MPDKASPGTDATGENKLASAAGLDALGSSMGSAAAPARGPEAPPITAGNVSPGPVIEVSDSNALPAGDEKLAAEPRHGGEGATARQAEPVSAAEGATAAPAPATPLGTSQDDSSVEGKAAVSGMAESNAQDRAHSAGAEWQDNAAVPAVDAEGDVSASGSGPTAEGSGVAAPEHGRPSAEPGGMEAAVQPGGGASDALSSAFGAAGRASAGGPGSAAAEEAGDGVHAAPLDDARRPAGMERPAEPDDLKMISGIGPKTEEMLHALGIYTFAQIASWDDAQRHWVGGIERDDWIGQARALAEGGEEEYVRVFGRKPR